MCKVHGAGLARVAAAWVVLALFAAPAALGQGLPARFVEETVFSGLNDPTALRFHPDGRVFVAEKRGLVRVFDSLDDATPTTLIDIRDRVQNYWDRGLLGLAIHPDFAAHPYVYVLYTFDARPGEAAPSWGDECPDPPGGTAAGCVVQGRLSRFRLAGNAIEGAEEVLIQDWCQQYPSHSIGALAFGADGALYVSGGDGADFNLVDYGQRGSPLNPCGDPPVAAGELQQPPGAEGGALRSQDLRTGGDPVGLAGTVLRVDPLTGAGLPDNPLFGGARADDDRIIAFGLRNPFRFALRPNTREVWIGDVGWGEWEELDVIADATDATLENFGWPCYEGAAPQPGYDSADLALCESLYATPEQHSAPFYAYQHRVSAVSDDGCGTGGSSISGLAFYEGTSFPGEYAGALFFADYARDCIWTMLPDASGRPDPARRRGFRPNAQGPVDLVVGPGGDLYYVALAADAVQRIRYANDAPLAQITATPSSGPVPLQVQLDGSGSSDPNGDALSHAWDLDDDGQFDDASGAALAHTFVAPGSFTLRLRVTDPTGRSDDAALVIDVDNTPPVAVVDAPLPSTLWRVGAPVAFSGHADDAEQGALPASALSWEVVLYHCAEPGECHEHGVTALSGVASGSFSAPDHAYPSYVELRLSATDPLGLVGHSAVAIEPETALLELTSDPPSLLLALDGEQRPSPFSVQAIVGSVHSVSAPSPQSPAGVRHELARWSDDGAASHLVTLAAGGTALQASFAPSCGNGTLQGGEACDDGNAAAGDCCAPDCSLAADGSACGDDGDPCTADRCDGAGACQHAPIASCETSEPACEQVGGCPVQDAGMPTPVDAGTSGESGTAGSAGEGAAGEAAGSGSGVTVGPSGSAGSGARAGSGAGAGSGARAGSGAGAGAGGSSAADSGIASADASASGGSGAEDDGCACTAPGIRARKHTARSWSLLLLLAASCALWRRKRRAHSARAVRGPGRA